MSWIMPKDSGETLKIFLQRPLWNLALKSVFGTWKLPKKLLAIQRQRIHKILFCKGCAKTAVNRETGTKCTTSTFMPWLKGGLQKLLSGFFPLRGGGVPPFPLRVFGQNDFPLRGGSTPNSAKEKSAKKQLFSAKKTLILALFYP